MSIYDLIHRLEDPNEIFQIFANESYWDSQSLAEGYPGILILFARLQLKDSAYEKVVHKYVLAIKNDLEKRGINNFSLFSGVTGICFALQSAAFKGRKYEKMLNTLHDILFQNIEIAYLSQLRHNLAMKRSSSSTLHDVIQGISGVGCYALENLSDPRFEQLAYEIIRILVKLCDKILVHGFNVPGWHLLSEDLLNSQGFFKSQNGNFNLGLAHGVSGILAFLSIALLKGVKVEGQENAVNKIAGWLLDWSFEENSMIRWPYQVAWEEETGTHPPLAEASRDGWCYGVPGISRALYLAGKAINSPKFTEFAKKAFLQLFNRSYREWGAHGFGLCHGVAGILLIAKIMLKEINEDLKEKITILENHVISSYQPQLPFGFEDIEQVRFPNILKTCSPGFLDGTAGILLTILTKPEDSFKWYTPLMVS